MSKMFVHYSGTAQAFKAAGLESKYNNHIVFIKGGTEGTGEAVYTHGQYYANVKDALAALQNQVNGLSYFRGIKKSGAAETAWAADKDGVITFSSTDPASVNVDITSKGVEIGLSKAFTDSVAANTAAIAKEIEDARAAEGKIRTDLGQKTDGADADGSAFARIAQVKADLASLQTSGVGDQIKTAIEGLDADVSSTDGSHVKVQVVEVDGEITEVHVTETDIASAADLKNVSDSLAETGAVGAKIKANADAIAVINGDAEGSIKKAVADAKALLDAEDQRLAGLISTEEGRAKGAEEALAGRLDVIEGEGEGSIKKAISDLVGDATEEYNTLGKLEDKIQAVEGAAKSYSIVAVTENLSENVKESFKLVDEDGVQAGAAINIYKDSSLKAVALDGQILNFTYILADGSESTVGVDVSAFLHESEYGNGLQVVDHIVSVKRDEASEAFLSVSEAGIKLAGVQDAIDAEANRAKAAEGELNTAIANEKSRAEGEEGKLSQAISAEQTRAEGKEGELAGAIAAEESRATGVESGLDNRIKAIEDDYLVAADKTELSNAINNEVTRAEGQEAAIRQEFAAADATTLNSAKTYTNDEIAKLDVEDAAVENQFVTAVSETDGKISVSRSAINASQIGISNTESDAFAAETQNVQDALTELSKFWEWEEL